MIRLITLLFLVGLRWYHATGHTDDRSTQQYFPESIPRYKVRRDIYSSETVSRGRLHLINYNVSNEAIPHDTEEQRQRMVTFADFQRHLQCASPEPELDGSRGSWSMIKMVPPTKKTVENVCAWTETNCQPWAACNKFASYYKDNMFVESSMVDIFTKLWGGFRSFTLLRVISNKLHFDWPWGLERFQKKEDPQFYNDQHSDHYSLLEVVLRLVKDIGDSVFLFGGERSMLSWNLPFSMFSFAPSISSADLPYPWIESFNMEVKLYARAEKAGNNFTDAFYEQEYWPWNKRIPKAALFATMTFYRQIIYDSAVLRPDLLDVSFWPNAMTAWNPLSDESDKPRFWEPKDYVSTNASARNHSGFLDPVLKFADSRKYSPHHYKYVIVPTGSADLSTSGRLAGLLAHSGAVVLLQSSVFAYHFSARLVPFVHYVPLSHSMADVIDKIEWLKRHDHLARQIVRNAENYAKSYLRLEDYLCYASGSLRLFSDLEKTTDVLQAFTPVKLVRRTVVDNESIAFQWPSGNS